MLYMNKIIYLILNYFIDNLKKNKVGRPNKMNNIHYLEEILNILKTGKQWNEITNILHYTTYHKKYMYWCKHKVFQNAYYILIKLLKYKNILKKENLENLYIDSTMIKNNRGIDLLGLNHYDRNRKGNKVSIIVTNTGIPLGMKLSTSNIPDIKLVEETINDIKIKIINSRIGGDKGYTSNKLKTKLKQQKINYIYYSKKNSILSNTEEDKIFLKKRYIVENTFGWLKNNKRLSVRYDSNSSNYIQYWYLAFIKLITNRYKDIIINELDLKLINNQ